MEPTKYNRYETTTKKKEVIYLIPLKKNPKTPNPVFGRGKCYAQSRRVPCSSSRTKQLSLPRLLLPISQKYIHKDYMPPVETTTDGGKGYGTDDTGIAEILCSTRRSGYDSSSVSVFVALVSSSSSSVPLSSSESSSTLRRGLGVWPVLRTCIWPARESETWLAYGHN